MTKKVISILLCVVMAIGLVAGCSNQEQTSSGSDSTSSAQNDKEAASDSSTTVKEGGDLVIAFSNSYNGSSFRQLEETYFRELGDQLKAEGVIKDYLMACANSNNATQVSQIQNFIMMGVDAIIVDPNSSTALNGAFEEAHKAGIPVIVIDCGPVTSPYPYQMNADLHTNYGALAEYLCESLNYEGNVMVIRGIAGVEFDEQAYQGMMDVINKYEGINVVAEVYGEWTNTVTQSEVSSILPSLPKIDGVIGQGGDAYGAIQAFKAADREVPVVIGGNRGDFVNWWIDEYNENGYETMSAVCTPWFSAVGMYLALDILNGVDVPKYTYYPPEIITVDNLLSYQGIDDTGIASTPYDWDWVRNVIESQNSDDAKPSIIEE